MRLKLEVSPRLMLGTLEPTDVLLLGPVPRRFVDSDLLRLRIRGIILDVKDSLRVERDNVSARSVACLYATAAKSCPRMLFMERPEMWNSCIEKAFLRGHDLNDDRSSEARSQNSDWSATERS